MSHIAMVAVLRYGPFQDPKYHTEMRVLQAISIYADDTGVAGIAGDQNKCPSRDALARTVGLHKNTINNLLPTLAELGVLSYEVHGEGRGRHTVYRLLLPLEPIDYSDYATIDTTLQANDVSIGSHNDTSMLELLTQQIALLTHQIELLTQRIELLTQRIDTIGTSHQANDVHDLLDPIPDHLDQEGEDARAREAAPPTPLPNELTPGEWVNLKRHGELLHGRSEALRLYTAVNEFPGHDNEWAVLERLGDSPDLEALRKAVSFWKASGHRMSNHIGICDWYLELRQDPTWTPSGRFKPKPHTNGRHPPARTADIDRSTIVGGRQ